MTALYAYPPLERTVELEAESPQRAMVKALIERHIPAAFVRDRHGWLQPVLWNPQLAGEQRSPTLVGSDTLAWGEPGRRERLAFYIIELDA